MWYINGRVESLPLTNMRNISGWVESLVLRRKVEDFFHSEDSTNEKHGVKFTPTQPDAMAILEKLRQEKN